MRSLIFPLGEKHQIHRISRKAKPVAELLDSGHAKYRQRLTLAAGEIPALTLKLKPGEDVLEAARDLVEDLKLAAEEAAGGTP